jgi:hypothetical protein
MTKRKPKSKPKTKPTRIALIAAGVLFVIAAVVSYYGTPKPVSASPLEFIQADFIDLSRIYSISKFRSGMGLDYSGGGESCRNMKHYFIPQQDADALQYAAEHDGRAPAPNGKDDIPIYSPVDGFIASTRAESNQAGHRIVIYPENAPGYKVSLFHITPSHGITGGTPLKAGQHIGVIGAHQTTDIDIQIGRMPWDNTSVSYFQVMPDRLFAAYQARGVTSRDDLIISRAYRDAHPLTCSGGRFVYPAIYDYGADIFKLSGYQATQR